MRTGIDDSGKGRRKPGRLMIDKCAFSLLGVALVERGGAHGAATVPDNQLFVKLTLIIKLLFHRDSEKGRRFYIF
jgi:hypothetical protein